MSSADDADRALGDRVEVVIVGRAHDRVDGHVRAEGVRYWHISLLGIRLAARARQAAMGGLQLFVPRLEGGCIEIGRDRRLGVLGEASQD